MSEAKLNGAKIGRKLREARERIGLSVPATSQLSGVSERQIYKLEGGTISKNPRVLYSLAPTLEMDWTGTKLVGDGALLPQGGKVRVLDKCIVKLALAWPDMSPAMRRVISHDINVGAEEAGLKREDKDLPDAAYLQWERVASKGD